MASINFEFLRAKRPVLAEYDDLAEQYAWPDPQGALQKLRNFLEEMVDVNYADLRLVVPRNARLNDLLNESAFQAAMPRVIQTKGKAQTEMFDTEEC